jgi:hydroxymethylpyrimidine/phosphomethylpyrimidine kinase
VQADVKTITALNAYAATAITALTAQNTEGVSEILAVDSEFVARQMEVVLADIGADCIKTGMLHRAEVIEAVLGVIDRVPAQIPLVVDPVMIAKGGTRLLDRAAEYVLRRRLLPRAAVVIPNIPEAEVLTGRAIRTPQEMWVAAERMRGLGAAAVLLKGGHLPGDEIVDILLWGDGSECFEAPRALSRHTHGTGCTLASAVASGLAQGMSLIEAVRRAWDYVQEAIRSAPGLGQGNGPLNHAHTVCRADF